MTTRLVFLHIFKNGAPVDQSRECRFEMLLFYKKTLLLLKLEKEEKSVDNSKNKLNLSVSNSRVEFQVTPSAEAPPSCVSPVWHQFHLWQLCTLSAEGPKPKLSVLWCSGFCCDVVEQIDAQLVVSVDDRLSFSFHLNKQVGWAGCSSGVWSVQSEQETWPRDQGNPRQQRSLILQDLLNVKSCSCQMERFIPTIQCVRLWSDMFSKAWKVRK